MKTTIGRLSGLFAGTFSAAALALLVGLGGASSARAGEAEAKVLLKAMSDYLASQKSIAFAVDTSFEVVTKDSQKISFASSGTVNLNRPDKIRVTRHGGFANVEMNFDGKTLTVMGKDANLYTQAEVPGSLDQLFDQLRDKFNKPIPGADLLMSNVYDELMAGVTDVKDLGSGVIGGIECDHLAFRSKDVDWQIWIAQGASPHPCRYVITTKDVDQGPQYSVQIRDWKTDSEAAADNFTFNNTTNARMVDLKDLVDIDELPSEFAVGGTQ